MKRIVRMVTVAALAAAGLVPAAALAGPAEAAQAGARLWAAQFPYQPGRTGGATALAVSPSQPAVYVTGYTVRNGHRHDTTVAYNDATGARLWQATFGGIGAIHTDASPIIAVSPDGATVYIQDNIGHYNGSVAVLLAYNAGTGALLWSTVLPTRLSYWAGRRYMTVSPDGSQLFLTGNLGIDFTTDVTVAVSAATGQQNWVASTPNQWGASRPTAIAVSPNGADVFITALNGTTAYSAGTGAQLWMDHYKLRWVRSPGFLAVSPDSATVYVTDGSVEGTRTSQHYVTTAYSTATGAQLWTARFDTGTLTAVAASPDGSSVFVTGSTGQGFVTIAYGAATGARLWITRALSSGGASALAVSPDGSAVYVTGPAVRSSGADEYATVAYDPATGHQLWAARYQGPSGASSTPAGLGVSPDGSSVFVTGTSTFTGHSEYSTIAYSG